MKLILGYILLFAIFIVFSPLIIPIIVICLIIDFLLTPIHKKKYYKSYYYEKYHYKYSPFIMMEDEYKFCNFIHDNNLDLEFVYQDDSCSYLKSKTTLYLMPGYEYVAYKNKEWVFALMDEDEIRSLKDGIKEEVEKIVENTKKKKIKIIVDIDSIPTDNIDIAMQSNIIVVFKNLDDLKKLN